MPVGKCLTLPKFSTYYQWLQTHGDGVDYDFDCNHRDDDGGNGNDGDGNDGDGNDDDGSNGNNHGENENVNGNDDSNDRHKCVVLHRLVTSTEGFSGTPLSPPLALSSLPSPPLSSPPPHLPSSLPSNPSLASHPYHQSYPHMQPHSHHITSLLSPHPHIHHHSLSPLVLLLLLLSRLPLSFSHSHFSPLLLLHHQGAEVVAVVQEAAMLALNDGEDAVTRKGLETAIAAVIPQITPEMRRFYADISDRYC